jgi:hypothetical protein
LELLGYLLTGATAAAAIKLLDNVILWHLNRKAKKDDESEAEDKEKLKRIEKEEKKRQQEEKEWKKHTNDRIEALAVGVRAILMDRIRFLGQKYLKEGEIDFDDRRLLNQMHGVYHNELGGNGDLAILMDEVNDLPLKRE